MMINHDFNDFMNKLLILSIAIRTDIDIHLTVLTHAFLKMLYTICPKKNYNRTFRMDNFQSSE